MPQNAPVSPWEFPEFTASITTNHRTPLALVSKRFMASKLTGGSGGGLCQISKEIPFYDTDA